MIAGALMYSKYPLPVKWLMKGIARKAGEDTDTSRDYEYTDWEQVRQYAQMLAS
jgi:menaquinone-dependent protoporphyrinogen oxidase